MTYFYVNRFFNKIAAILMAMFILSSAVLGQTTPRRANISSQNKAQSREQSKTIQRSQSENQPTVPPPVADHHLHLMSLNLSTLLTEPLLPVVELPEEFNRLLRDKEKFGGRNKNLPALTDLYTKDVLVQDPRGPTWYRGESAVGYVTGSTSISRLVPTAYELNGSAGYIAGYEADGEGPSTEYLDNFLYFLRKDADGKWRISVETFTIDPPRVPKALTVEKVVKDLDDAGIKRGAILSLAYMFGSAFRKPPADEYAKVRAENDWVASQVARFPDRLVAFCSFSPLKDYAVDELNRCAQNQNIKGLKLHLGNSGVNIGQNPQHVEKIRQIFRLANEKRLPIVIHFWNNPAYETEGGEHAKVFLNQILPSAPNIIVQVAHMAGGGRSTDPALAVFAQAIAAGDPRTKNLYFDVATLPAGQTDEGLRKDAERMRQIGFKRILFGTDMAPPHPASGESWETFRKRMPLTAQELRIIAGNVAPYLR